MRKLFLIHKWLALIFSLPLLVLAISGFTLSIAPKEKKGQSEVAVPIPVQELLSQQKEKHPSINFMRAVFSPSEVTVLAREKEVRAIKISRGDGSIISSKKPTDDFFVLSKIIHESFLMEGPGKKVVGLSGVALTLILISGFLFWMKNSFRKNFSQLFRKESFRKLSPFHVFIGVFSFLPLLFASVSGALIEYNNFFMNDRPMVAHEKPVSCEWDDVLNVMRDRVTAPAGMIMFCRPGHPYITISGKDGLRQYTPKNIEVLFVPKEDWAGQRGTRKHWFVHWHGGENFGPLEFTYQLINSVSLLVLIITGTVLWARRKRKI